MRKTWNIIRQLLLFGSVVTICIVFSSCNQHTKHQPQSQKTIKTQPQVVEQQLLATINNAENLGQNNPLLLSSLYSLAHFYRDHQEYNKAANQYERILHIKENLSGPNHQDIAPILKQYAQVLQAAKRPTQAANLLARANAILAQSNSPTRAQ